MRIVNSLVEDFGGFELDAGAVELHSEKPQDIILPYCGALPGRMSSASSAYLQVNVQPTQGAQLVLVVNKGTGKVRRPLEATNEEIIDLLDKFFEQKNTGLDAYWLGFEQANYIGWKQIAQDFRRLLKMVRALPMDERTYISRHLLE